MTEQDTALLQALPALALQAALLFCRLGAAVMLLPGLGEQEVPTTLRLGLGMALMLALLPVLAPLLPAEVDSVPDLLRLVALEVVVGLWLGTLARLMHLAIAEAGQVMGSMIGLSTPLQGDLLLGAQSTALGRILGLAGTALVLSTGLYQLPLAALVNSYQAFPAGGALPGGEMAEAVAGIALRSLELALQLAAPFIVAATLFQVGIGLISRLTPHVQVSVIAAPAQILAGIGLLALMLPAILGLWQGTLREVFSSLPGMN